MKKTFVFLSLCSLCWLSSSMISVRAEETDVSATTTTTTTESKESPKGINKLKDFVSKKKQDLKKKETTEEAKDKPVTQEKKEPEVKDVKTEEQNKIDDSKLEEIDQDFVLETKPEVKAETKKDQYLEYVKGTRYYITPDGKRIKDLRKTGPLNPTLFDVARKDAYDELYMQNEDEEKGCNLELAFRKNIFPVYGADIRRYINALAAKDCSTLASSAERAMCDAYRNNPACSDVFPVVLEALPLPAGESYLKYKKDTKFDCASAYQTLASNTYVPKESVEWRKIERDLIDEKRKAFVRDLKANLPMAEIKAKLAETNPSPTQKEIDFAVQDYVYEKSQAFTARIPDEDIQEIVQKRYTPFGVMTNLKSFSEENGYSCSRAQNRYDTKMYGEIVNIPPHLLLLFADYTSKESTCICK